MRRGSALIVALWIIAALSVMVFSFAFEAHQQAGVNLFVRERNRVRRLVEPGRIIGEAIVLGYQDAKSFSVGENEKDLDEEDRFWREKRALKDDSKCTVGPLLLDEDDEEAGVVTIEIETASTGDSSGINVNRLYEGDGGDKNYALRWRLILRASGVPEDLEVEATEPDGRSTRRHNLMNLLIASWQDWRDGDDVVSKGPLTDSSSGFRSEEDDGAEKVFYDELNERLLSEARSKEEREAVREQFIGPRDGKGGPVPDVKELAMVRGFRDFPAVLTGGLLHPDEEESEENPRFRGVVGVFSATGDGKINVNSCTAEQLLTVPGVVETDSADADDMAEAEELARAIVETRRVMPENRDDVDDTRDWWPYKDWNDLVQRVSDAADLDIGSEAQQYLRFKPEESTLFRMTIRTESMGMSHVVECECYAKDGKVRYVSWKED